MLLFQGPRPWISIFSRLCHSSCLCISIFKRILGSVSAGKWAYSGQGSPVHARTPDIEVPLVNYPERGEEVAFCQRRHVHIVDFCTWENKFTARRKMKRAKKAWWSEGSRGEQTGKAPASTNKDTWEGSGRKCWLFFCSSTASSVESINPLEIFSWTPLAFNPWSLESRALP